jgi:type IV pilus assembly protein PilC
MIDAGLPLVQCLEILAGQAENKTLGKTLDTVQSDVEGGAAYAEALGRHPKVFDDLYVNMVAAGETGGILDTILSRLAAYMEKAMSLKKKVKSAMVYPLTILGVAVGVIAILMVFVIPKFADMFTGMGGELPALTQIVIDISNFAASYKMLFAIGVFFIFSALFKRYYGTEKGKRRMDGIFLRAPVFGPLIRKVAVAKFTRTLGTMLSSGVPLLDALEICARTAGNKVVEDAVFSTRDAISEGKTIAEPLEETKVFPPMVVQMISVGEATGALDSMLNKIADFYDDEVDTAVDGLTSLMEPVMMVFLGGAIGFVVIAMYLPIFKMATLG